MPTRFQKKLIYLRYSENTLMKTLRKQNMDRTIRDEERLELLLGQNACINIRRWLSQPNAPVIANLDAWSQNVTAKLGIARRVDLFDDTVRSHEFGAMLGLSRTACKYLVDANHIERHETIESIVYNREQAGTVAGSLAGVYELILDVPGADRCYLSALQIRYYLPLDMRAKHKMYRVRCKVNILGSHETVTPEDESIVEYDGYLSYQMNHLYFVFESRSYFEGRRLLSLSFGGGMEKISGESYFIGDYLRSEPLNHGLRRGGVALLRNVVRDRRLITPEMDLTRLVDDDHCEKFMRQLPAAKEYGEMNDDYRRWLSK